MTHKDFRLSLTQNLTEWAGSLPRPHWPLGRPCFTETSYMLEVNFSSHWPYHSSRLCCPVCSARGIKKKEFKSSASSVMWDCAWMSVLKITTPH
jgi:hypothetical protein